MSFGAPLWLGAKAFFAVETVPLPVPVPVPVGRPVSSGLERSCGVPTAEPSSPGAASRENRATAPCRTERTPAVPGQARAECV